jgi:hypothetical protein
MKKRADARRDRGKSEGLTEEKAKGLAGIPILYDNFTKSHLSKSGKQLPERNKANNPQE